MQIHLLAQQMESWMEIIRQEQDPWVYYALSGLFFVLCGLACGYFIWRKGHMQMLDAELEVQRTSTELESLRDDLDLEENELQPAADQQG
tara:strand:- start:1523 stop:1792 length:270 start_codon:yes stop_codon:yes gene_type:complete